MDVDQGVPEDAMQMNDGISSVAAENNASDGSDDQLKIKLRTDMIARVAVSEAHFKHQQRGEPDLTIDEKSLIANDILNKSPSMFLSTWSRFKQFLTVEDTKYFEDMQGDYEIDFYLKEIVKQQDIVHSHKVVKNRRYAAMQELMKQGDYFSEDEMKWRDPLLYEQMVGQYLTEEEIQSKIDKTDLRFSNILLKHMDQLEENALYALQKEVEECQDEEEEEESEEEMSAEDDEDQDNQEKKPKVSDIEKQMLKSEFLQIMQERFISGKDEDFDYSEVDKNINYDSLDTLEKDEEEKYFDEEEPCTVDSASYSMVDSPQIIAKTVTDGTDIKNEETEDYMNCQIEPDVTTATSKFDKMAVSQINEEITEKG